MVFFKAENLTFQYPDSNKKALDNVSVTVNKGDFVLVMGKTGSGKSTLLSLINPAVSPYGRREGKAEVNSKSIGYVAQSPENTFVSAQVRGELAFSLENIKADNNTIALKIGEIASFFNLTELLDREISTLSGGEKAAVSIAAAMINDADAIILDEPTSQLDSKASFELINILKRLNSELGVTVIMSSHQSDGIIDACDKLMVLDRGKCIFYDKPENVNDSVLPFYPLSARLFDSHPLTVKEAVKYAPSLCEKPCEKQAISREIVRLKNITFAYGKNTPDVLDRLNFSAYEGKIHCVIGSNGSGKTTLLKVIAGIKKPYSGKVKIDGKIAYLPQNPRYLFTKDTVGEEIDPDSAKAFGLDEHMTQHPYDLSVGQMQKLALAILFKQDFDILLLDEPTKALDVFNKNDLAVFLKNLGKTVIMVSHDLDFVGDTADFVSFLSDGVITIAGERRQVLSSLNFYTTQLRRITKGCLDCAVSAEDLE